MQKYIDQLLEDIRYVQEDIQYPWIEKEWSLEDWLPPDEDRQFAPKRSIEEWTGIKQEMLPDAKMLNKDQIKALHKALRDLLSAYHCDFVILIDVPLSIQYQVMRTMWKQEHAWLKFHESFFEFCEEDKEHGSCTLGPKYCHCLLFENLFSQFDEEEPAEEDDEFWEEIERQRRKRRDWWD